MPGKSSSYSVDELPNKKPAFWGWICQSCLIIPRWFQFTLGKRKGFVREKEVDYPAW